MSVPMHPEQPLDPYSVLCSEWEVRLYNGLAKVPRELKTRLLRGLTIW